jgi:hypothetical protein
MAKLKLDLPDIYNKGKTIEKERNKIMEEAAGKKVKKWKPLPGREAASSKREC